MWPNSGIKEPQYKGIQVTRSQVIKTGNDAVHIKVNRFPQLSAIPRELQKKLNN